jgi:hypothetical protein
MMKYRHNLKTQTNQPEDFKFQPSSLNIKRQKLLHRIDEGDFLEPGTWPPLLCCTIQLPVQKTTAERATHLMFAFPAAARTADESDVKDRPILRKKKITTKNPTTT